MEDLQLLDAIERYLDGTMSPWEKEVFEQLRKTNPEVDQRVVEHTMFLQQMDRFGEWKRFKNTLHDVHNQLLESGDIKEQASKATVIQLWRKYKRVVAVAASIAGIITLSISAMTYYLTPKGAISEIRQLSRQLNEVKNSQQQTDRELIILKKKSTTPQPVDVAKVGGTGFLIDGKGILVTSAHVVINADSVYIQNMKGDYFKVTTLYADKQSDVAILKIQDDRFQPIRNLPYSLDKSATDLGEEVFTLGFPRNSSSEIVYNRGYMSAATGYQGDSATYQIAINANPGNSGGPVFNEDGEVIGILSGKQITAEGVVFTSKTKNIFTALNELKKDQGHHIKLTGSSGLKTLGRVKQIKKIEDCMFMVKSY
jgi:serine protease Do